MSSISNEDLELIKKAQQAIIKLDSGGTIVGGSQEHLDLSRAITKLSGMVLFDTRPLTESERKHGEIVLESKGNLDIL